MDDKQAGPVVTEKPVFYPERVVAQIKAFFRGVRDLSDFYYKLALLNGLCQECDGRGYLCAPDQPCPHCQASGSSDVWHRAKVTAGKRAEIAPQQETAASSTPDFLIAGISGTAVPAKQDRPRSAVSSQSVSFHAVAEHVTADPK